MELKSQKNFTHYLFKLQNLCRCQIIRAGRLQAKGRCFSSTCRWASLLPTLPSYSRFRLPSAVESRDTSGAGGGATAWRTCMWSLKTNCADCPANAASRTIPTQSAQPGRRCPNEEQHGRGQQTTVPVSPHDQGGAAGECSAACASPTRPSGLIWVTVRLIVRPVRRQRYGEHWRRWPWHV